LEIQRRIEVTASSGVFISDFHNAPRIRNEKEIEKIIIVFSYTVAASGADFCSSQFLTS
jgi:hypothetical protein